MIKTALRVAVFALLLSGIYGFTQDSDDIHLSTNFTTLGQPYVCSGHASTMSASCNLVDLHDSTGAVAGQMWIQDDWSGTGNPNNNWILFEGNLNYLGQAKITHTGCKLYETFNYDNGTQHEQTSQCVSFYAYFYRTDPAEWELANFTATYYYSNGGGGRAGGAGWFRQLLTVSVSFDPNS